ncbi:unnamed protein product [Effrenium voratum]|uniref:FHA domain-containing protein n=1 Tax=Effrenium voratum TaxID=2562239 RepID=A0AA36ICG2_9DINO|nr:unnamed protein product [Effrenium voratum]
MGRDRSRSRSASDYSYTSYSEEDAKKQAAKAAKGAGAADKGQVKRKAQEALKAKEPKAKAPRSTDASPQANAAENLREMLAERERELAEEVDPDRKKDKQKDIEILKQWLKDKEAKAIGDAPAKAKDGSSLPKATEPAAMKEPAKAAKAGKTSKKVSSKEEPKAKAGKSEAKKPVEKKKEEVSEKKASKKVSSTKEKEPAKAKEEKTGEDGKQQVEQKKSEADKKTPKKVSSKEEPKKPKQATEKMSHMQPQQEIKEKATDEVKETDKKDQLLKSAEMIERAKQALLSLSQQKAEAAAGRDVSPEPHEVDAEASPMDKVTVLMPSEKVPPCELPLWCVMPNPRDVEAVFEIVRQVSGVPGPPKRLQLGRRAWALLGRRLPEAQVLEAKRAGVPEPDIGLACPISSKAHALVMQNWLGKIFLQDLGSTHGTFLGGMRLKPHEPCEWKPSMQAYFGDPQLEYFELR